MPKFKNAGGAEKVQYLRQLAKGVHYGTHFDEFKEGNDSLT